MQLSNPARLLPQLSHRAAATESSAIRELLSQARQPGMISLAGGLPDASRFPTRQLGDIAELLLAEQGSQVLQYGLTQGDEDARHGLTRLFGPGVSADELVVTTGSQQALDLIARTMLNPGDHVIVGDPDYLGALQVFRGYGANVRPIAIDSDGIDTDQLAAQLKRGLRPKCCYIVPHFHNPTGVTLSVERRGHLNELATRYGFLVVEDDPYRELYYDGVSPRDDAIDLELTVQLRSTSKTLAPGLRVGALRGPEWLVDSIVTAKQSADLHTSSLSQAIAAKALASPWFDLHLDELRSCYRSKRDALAAAFRASFGDTARFDLPTGGMFVWIRFDHITDTTDWLTRCLERGVCFVPGASFAVERDLSSYARLSFATGSVADLEQGVSRMASC